jgi:hypothetical protein
MLVNVQITQDDALKIGPMECMASCLLSYSIIKNWSTINLLLPRYSIKKRQNSAPTDTIDPIVTRCKAVKTLELHFLKFMDQIGLLQHEL